MPEVLGAIALVQLHKLEGVLTAMRARKHMLKAGMTEIAQRKGVTFRASVDEEGDAAIAHVFFMPTAQKAHAVADALRAENVGASVLYSPDVPDYHIYAHWEPVMEKRAWAPGGNPWQWAQREITYTHDMCPRSLDLLGRAVHLNVSPLLTNEDVEETIEGINRVIGVLG
jgi:dTDP-4-amino-4,6-dideoxygalactose transaminase